MHKPTDIGPNRTGIKTSPIDSKRTMQGAAESAGPMTGLDGAALEAERVRWSRDAYPVGTVPPPGSVKGMLKSVLEALEGHKAGVFIDKLGERLAFERTGCRLYDALLAKFEGRSSLRTFLTVVIQRLFLDHRISAWGKWRPSAEARRGGSTRRHESCGWCTEALRDGCCG